MKKKQWEPRTITGYCSTDDLRIQFTTTKVIKGGFYGAEPVRIIREEDFQRLLKLARKAQTAKRTL